MLRVLFFFFFFSDWIWRMENIPFTAAEFVRIVESIIIKFLNEPLYQSVLIIAVRDTKMPVTCWHMKLLSKPKPALEIDSQHSGSAPACRAAVYVMPTRGGASPAWRNRLELRWRQKGHHHRPGMVQSSLESRRCISYYRSCLNQLLKNPILDLDQVPHTIPTPWQASFKTSSGTLLKALWKLEKRRRENMAVTH